MFSVSNLDGDQTPYHRASAIKRGDLGPVLGTTPTEVYGGISSIGQDSRSSAFKRQFQPYQEEDLKRELQKKVLAKDIMSYPVFTLNLDASFEELWEALVIRCFKHIPIVNQENKILGMASDRSLINLLKLGSGNLEETFNQTGMEEIMRHPVISCAESTDIHHMAHLMIEERVRAITVLKLDRLVGLVTRNDILRCLTYTKPLDIFL